MLNECVNVRSVLIPGTGILESLGFHTAHSTPLPLRVHCRRYGSWQTTCMHAGPVWCFCCSHMPSLVYLLHSVCDAGCHTKLQLRTAKARSEALRAMGRCW